MYNNIVYQFFQNYYDTSNSVYTNISNNILNNNNNEQNFYPNYYDTSNNNSSENIVYRARDISSTHISFLMERIFAQNNTYSNTMNDTSFIAYRFAPNTYLYDTNFLDRQTTNIYGRYYFSMLRELIQNNTNRGINTDTGGDSFLENFINSTFENNTEKFKKVISDYELEQLKPQNFIKNNEHQTNNQCPIYCYNFEENEEIIKLPCNHNFNCEAITKWLTQESNTCPVCRYEFDYKEINFDNKRQELQDNIQDNIQDIPDNIQDIPDNIEEDEEEQYNIEDNTDFYNIISEEELILQEILLYAYSNNNNSNNNNNNNNNNNSNNNNL